MKTENDWVKCSESMPKESIEVMTKIHDEKGDRNETSLTRYRGLWFFPDMSMYVYYSPTHWRPL